MPRRRGSNTITGRRTTDDGRCNGNNKKTTTTAPSSKPTKTPKESVSPSSVQSANEAPPETTQSTDLGYLHKKFKKVAAPFATTPEPAIAATATLAAAIPAEPVEESTTTTTTSTTTLSLECTVDNTKDVPDSNGSSKSKTAGRYVCPYCQHACAKPSVLEKHIRAHTNERPYPCEPCGFAFKTKSNLYKHCKSRTHVLKLEESGGTASGSIAIDPSSVEGGSDDTSDDNAMQDDSDEGEPLVPSVVPSSPDKFKTPYKPKFHLKTSTEDASSDQPVAAAAAPPVSSSDAVGSTAADGRPSAGFLQERISQIISKNQAIVETLDPIWPRRYVRQASRDKETTTSAAAAVSVVKVPPPRPNDIASPPRKTTGVAGRERSCSLSVIPLDPVESGGPSAVQLAQPSSTLLVLQEEESHRKRCRSEGPAVVTEIQLRHSVLNLLHHQPTKPPPHVINPQNPEGSIIKDILLKSRGLLPSEAAAAAAAKVDDPIPTKMSSSFTVSALLNPSTTRAPITNSKPIIIEYPNLETSNNDDPSADRPPSKRLKVSPPNDVPYPDIRPEQQRQRTSLSLFGGEVEIHDGPQRTVMRIDPIGFGESGRLSNGLDAITVTKNSGGGIVRVQPQESRISVFPVIKPTAFESSSAADSLRQTSVPYIPGIPGPYSSNSAWMPTSTLTVASSSSNFSTTTTTSASRPPLPSITVHPPSSHPEAERTDSGFDDDDQSAAAAAPTAGKFLRPNSLSLQPGTFSMKKTNMAGLDHSGQPNMLCVSGAGMTLISPETPRPRKLFRQLYLNGHAYTHLGLKCSTRVYFCCLSRAQPMYVPHHPKLSMYSQWKTRAPVAPTPGLEDSSPVQTMALYDSRQRPTAMTTSQSADHSRMILTHSSYWTNRDRPTTTHLKLEVTEDHPPTEAIQLPVPEEPPRSEAAASPPPPPPQQPPAQPKRVRIFAGGYKSTEEYTYVRGRGRGRYVCEECGIRCKKPSMLKKHIRTHTDLRPYTCRQCNFSFKTKGNLTKHMKSKAHHKKCTELGIVPVPTTVDEANIDEDSLARQETLKKMKLAGGSGNEGDSDLDDDDDDDEEDDEDEEVEGEEEEDEAEEEQSAPALLFKSAAAGQFEDAAEQPARGEREQEVARSLLDLGVMAPAGCKPTTYPYASHFNPPENEEPPAIKIPEMKEEPAPSPLPVVRAHQPMDLSTSSVAVVKTTTAAVAAAATAVANASLLGSIYSSAETIRRPLSPEEPATSGMLQAYLTEKALKEGCIKRQQVKPISSVPVSAFSSTTTTASVVVEHPVVTFLPTRLDKSRPEFVVPTTAVPMSTSTSAAFKLTDDGKTACSICNKVFTKPSQLRLHINIHYFERPFRCEACAVSFRTKGHLQKHKRSVTHFNKVNMNLTFGTPSTENPRPFKCSDCMIAFRIHGHLAKHLRSKMHIMKLECLGKLPFGTYAEMERSGINLNEIDTTDCHNSLESLQSLAHRLYKQDPSKIQQWQQEAQVAAEASLRERTISGSSEEFSDMADDGDEMDEDGEDSDGLPDGAGVDEAPPRKEESPPVPQWPMDVNSQPPRAASPPAETRRAAPPPPRAMYCSECGESCASMEAFQMHVMEKHRPPAPPSPPPPRTPVKSPPPSESLSKMAVRSTPEPGRVVNLAMESRRSPPRMEIESVVSKPIATNWNRGDLQYAQPRFYHHPATASSVLPPPSMWPPRQPPTFGDLMNLNSLSAMPPQWHQDPAAMAWIASRHMMLPPLSGHPHNYSVPQGHAHTATANGAIQQRLYSPTSSSSVNPVANEDPVFPCELCGKSFSSKETLRQHMLAHAQPRPFVCEFCDAGFTTQKLLESHLVLHRPRTS